MNLVSPPEKRGVVELKLVGELLRAYPLRDPAKHQHHFATVVVCPRPNRIRKRVEHRPALVAAILHQRSTASVVRRLALWQGVSLRAAEALRVEGVEQVLVAFLFAQKIGDRKTHGHGKTDKLKAEHHIASIYWTDSVAFTLVPT